MAASRLAGIVDPTKPGEYPIVLSDALLGKSSSKETFTGITYNHKPSTLSSDSSSSTARIRSSTNGVVDLSHETAKDGTYGFTGARSTKDGQYVLVFDPARRVFVLHRLDSMFHMNLTLTPDNEDAAALKEEFPHLEPPKLGMGKAGAVGSAKGKDKAVSSARAAAAAKNRSGISTGPKPAAKKKAEKKAAPQPVALPLPSAAPTPPLPSLPKAAAEPAKDSKAKKPTRRKLSDNESDDDDDDGGLVLEFPEGSAPAPSRAPRARNDFSPAFPIRRFSEFARGEGEGEDEEDYGRTDGAGAEEEDADGEDDEEYEDMLDVDDPGHLKLPSPLNGSGGQQVGLGIGRVLAADGGDDEMDEDDELEAELEKQLMEEDEEMNGEESDVSEEE